MKNQSLIKVEAQPVGHTAAEENIAAIDGMVASIESTFFSGKNEHTIRSDMKSLEVFGKFLGVSSFRDMARAFLGYGQGEANMKALRFRNWLIDQKKAPSTVNRRLGPVSGIAKAFRFAGAIPWVAEVKFVKVESYRDTAGPGTARFSTLMESLVGKTDPMTVRDRTILILLHDGGLRRGELVSIDLDHYDPAAPCVWVKAKKRTARVKIDLAQEMKAAIEEWLKIRGTKSGAMFTNFGRATVGGRLSDRSVARITKRYKIGHPHGIRHLAIGEFAEATNGNVIEVMKFARQKDPKTTMAYIDNLEKRDAKASQILAGFRKPQKQTIRKESHEGEESKSS